MGSRLKKVVAYSVVFVLAIGVFSGEFGVVLNESFVGESVEGVGDEVSNVSEFGRKSSSLLFENGTIESYNVSSNEVVVLSDNRSVRFSLAGITPAGMSEVGENESCVSSLNRSAAREKLVGERVRVVPVELDLNQTELESGRVLLVDRNTTAGGVLVSRGLAVVNESQVASENSTLLSAQEEARKAERGVWKCAS